MTSGVKSNKTFEEIVERLGALFKLESRSEDKDYETIIEVVSLVPPQTASLVLRSPKKKK
jgi:hypothetical protein